MPNLPLLAGNPMIKRGLRILEHIRTQLIKKPFEQAQRVIFAFWVFLFGVFKVAKSMSRTFGMNCAAFDDAIVDRRAVSEEYAFESFQHPLRMYAAFVSLKS